MTAPQRVQRRRTRGWRMPPGARYVGRPTVYGNPFVVLSEEILVHDDGRDWWCPAETGGARQAAVDMYRQWAVEHLDGERLVADLAGRDLACWCPLTDAHGRPMPCHADVLLAIANGAPPG